MQKVNDAFASVVNDTPEQPDTLEAAQRLVSTLRDLDQQIADLDERRALLAAKVDEIRKKTLVDLMATLGLRKIAIEPSGNSPGYEATLRAFYKASIPADWPQDRQDAAFNWLEQAGDGDLIKHTFTVALSRDDYKIAAKVRKALEKMAVQYDERRAVHHGTLTAWLKEQVGDKKRTGIPLDVLGAIVGQQVDVKKLKTT